MWLRLSFSNLKKIWTSLTLISSLGLWSLTFYQLAYQVCFSIRQKLKTGKNPGGKCLLLTRRGEEINKNLISLQKRGAAALCGESSGFYRPLYTARVVCTPEVLEPYNLCVCGSDQPPCWMSHQGAVTGQRRKDEPDKPALSRTCISTHKRVRCGSPPFWKLLLGRNSCDSAAAHGTKVTAGCFYLFIWLCHILVVACGI